MINWYRIYSLLFNISSNHIQYHVGWICHRIFVCLFSQATITTKHSIYRLANQYWSNHDGQHQSTQAQHRLTNVENTCCSYNVQGWNPAYRFGKQPSWLFREENRLASKSFIVKHRNTPLRTTEAEMADIQEYHSKVCNYRELKQEHDRKYNTSDEAKIHETFIQVLEHAGFTLSRFFSNFLKESPKDTTMLGWNIFADVLSVKSINCLEFSSPRKLTSLIARCCEMTVIVFLYIFLVKRSLCLSFSVIKLCKFFPSFFLAASSDKLCRAQWNLIFKTTSRP